jgi:hypothetical protein
MPDKRLAADSVHREEYSKYLESRGGEDDEYQMMSLIKRRPSDIQYHYGESAKMLGHAVTRFQTNSHLRPCTPESERFTPYPSTQPRHARKSSVCDPQPRSSSKLAYANLKAANQTQFDFEVSGHRLKVKDLLNPLNKQSHSHYASISDSKSNGVQLLGKAPMQLNTSGSQLGEIVLDNTNCLGADYLDERGHVEQMSLIYKEHELARSKGKTFSIQHIQSLVQGQSRVGDASMGKDEQHGSQ